MESPDLPRPAVATGRGGNSKMPAPREAFELKGTMAPLTVLRLHTVDLMQIERQLRWKIAQRPQMFRYAPVLLDLVHLEDAGALAVAALISLMRAFKLVPMGVINAPDSLAAPLAASGLGILPLAAQTPKPRAVDSNRVDGHADAPTPPPVVKAAPSPTRSAPASGFDDVPTPAVVAHPVPPPPPPPARVAHGGPMVVTNPVRSGQVVYAQNSDLVVLAPVNPGAQVMADGHVHIYSTLRGRAIAGAQGLAGARIFVQKMEAELVAIGDAYVLADEVPAKLRGRAVQVHVEGADCRIEAL